MIEDVHRSLPFHITRVQMPPQQVRERPVGGYQLDVHLGRPTRMAVSQNGCARAGIVLPGEIIYTPAGGVCGGAWQDPRDVAFVSIAGTFVEQVTGAPASDSLPRDPRFRARDPLIHQLALTLADAERREPADHLYVESLATALVAHLARGSSLARGREESVWRPFTGVQLRRALDYAESHLGDAIRLSDWAAHVGLSTYAFARRFREAAGVSPHRFLLDRRVERAKDLLRRGDASLAEIAYALGFSSQSHFTRAFRRRTGVTPGAWPAPGRRRPPAEAARNVSRAARS